MRLLSDNLAVQWHYEISRANGCEHRLAEMLALQAFPGTLGTDRAFMQGQHGGEQFAHDPEIGDFYRKAADDAGVSITGKRMMHGLARYPGDPKAWVSGVDDVKRICRENNWTARGSVNHKGHEVEPMADVPIAPDIVESRMDRMGVPQQAREHVREAVMENCLPSKGAV